ncbi:OLC1v1017625C1 [Oldenlandia corymbosa var. corymbosa]|uniref:OLC1v1017625C1 n=1 Tax=Oldenlandia corymbosa var. corymbosa TaxID=529605 RepID=A0AAV1E9X7_OLDCO|nr:OLC1v1017625C1 [Oldenlandia corymbosa var. corymbosa]
MAKIPNSAYYGVCFLASIILNIFLITNPNKGRWNNQLKGWSDGAASEAEAVASIQCSGHGRAYVDGLKVDGKPVCECNLCFQGPYCSEFVPDCPADADRHDPLFLEPFWMRHAASSALLVAGWHRMSYVFPDQTYVSEELENYIRKLHAIAKNAVTDGKYIAFGCGSTQLINAAVFALSSQNSSSPSRVVALTPYYPLYKSQTDYFQTAHFEFGGDASLMKNNSDASQLIEFVTSPNNPDCQLRKGVLQGPYVRTVYDHAYYWPHFTAIPAPADEDVMIFTLSKLTGHAGSRLGVFAYPQLYYNPSFVFARWAIIKDKDVFDRMVTYVTSAELGVSKDTQLRALKLLKVLTKEGNGREIFDYGFKTMMERWKRLSQTLSSSTRFSLQEISPNYCNFYDKVRDPSPAYAWLKCENEEDTDCTKVLRAANIIGRPGSLFNVENRYVRLSILRRQDDFELLLYRINKLVKMDVKTGQSM